MELEDKGKPGNLPLAIALHSSSEKGKGHAVGSIRPGRSGRSGSWGLLERTAHTLLLPVEAIGSGFQLGQTVIGRDNQECGGMFMPHTPWGKGIILVKGIQKSVEHSLISFSR